MALAINLSSDKFVIPVHVGEYTEDGFLKKFGDFNLSLYPDVVDGSGGVAKEKALENSQHDYDAAKVLAKQAKYFEALEVFESCLAIRLKFL